MFVRFIDLGHECLLHLVDETLDGLDTLPHQTETANQLLRPLSHLSQLRVVLGVKQGELVDQRLVIQLVLGLQLVEIESEQLLIRFYEL